MRARGLLDVVVVGAGAVGAGVAAALAQASFDVALVEPHPPAAAPADSPLDPRVIALSPASVRCVERIGAWPLPATRAFAYRDMEVRAQGEVLHFGRELVGEAALGWIVELRALQASLFAAARTRVAAVHASRLVHCERGEHDARLELEDGTRLRTRLVVAAEGGRSSLREAAGIAVDVRDYRARAIVAHLTTERPNPGIAFQRFLPGGPLALLPIDGGRSSLVWTRPEADAEALLALDDAAFCAVVSAASDQRFGVVSATSARHAFPLRLQLAQRYHAHRLVLLGDTAHVVHPLAGLGLNLGLIDAAALVDVLAQARARGRDIGSAGSLSRFDSWRRSDTHAAARAIDAIERGFSGDMGRFGNFLSRGLGLVDQLTPAKRFFAAAACGDIGRVPTLAQR
jgi:2-octaprenyl-3-methyl-6-methoxy-1,4-benzoquinol hydroxylase/2-octaprenylphenol hydroxylase